MTRWCWPCRRRRPSPCWPLWSTPLAGSLAAALAAALAPVRLAPCWTVPASFSRPLPLPDLLRPDPPEPVGWAAGENAKPGRGGPERWVVQAGPETSRAWLEDAPEAHRWRHARVAVPLGRPCLWEPGLRLGLAGDWCLAPRAEAAFDSGEAVAAAPLG